MIVIMAVMLVLMFGGGHAHTGMMGHGNSAHQHSATSSTQSGELPDDQH